MLLVQAKKSLAGFCLQGSVYHLNMTCIAIQSTVGRRKILSDRK